MALEDGGGDDGSEDGGEVAALRKERDLGDARGRDGVCCSEDGGEMTAPRTRARGCVEAGAWYRGGEIICCSGSGRAGRV
jgi:hypothetical protein